MDDKTLECRNCEGWKREMKDYFKNEGDIQ